MKSRRQFLTRFFELLDHAGVPFLVLRNFAMVHESNASDVDLLAIEVEAVFRAGQKAADDTGMSLVQRARFVNHSWVWWDGKNGFIRVDVDRAVRWRWFEGIAARGMLDRRLRYENFWIPSPTDETAALLVHLAARGSSSARYDSRLGELGASPGDPARERRMLLIQNLLNPLRWPTVVGHLAHDMGRYFHRRRNLPGQAVVIAAAGEFNPEATRKMLEPLFPSMHWARGEDAAAVKKALFTVGLSIRVVHRPAGDLVPVLRATGRTEVGRRNHVLGMVEAEGRLYGAETDGGWMSETSVGTPHAAVAALAHFICASRARNLQEPTDGRGKSVLLVGVDGAGKTTIARMLFERAMSSRRFNGCRYFHWIPPLSRGVDFPWPVSVDQPRHSGSPPKIGSLFRLWRNVLRAKIAWRMRVAPLVRAGRLVLLDRFMANYWLDPESVRYGAGDSFLRRTLHWIPKADVMIALDADPDVLAARKGELSIQQIREQQQRLRSLPDLAMERWNFDAAQPPHELVEAIFERLAARP